MEELMPRNLALFSLIFAALACSLPFSGPTETRPAATPDVATLVAENLTAAAEESLPDAPPAADTPTPEPIRANLSVVYARAGNILLWREGTPPLTLTASGQDNSPRISDDGQVIAFLRNGELYSVRADGTGERSLVSQAYLDGFRTADMLAVRIFNYDFIPDSHEVFFELYGETEAYPAPLSDLQRVNADSGAMAVILAPGSAGGKWTFSPDGQRFALSQGAQIRVLGRDGSEDRVVFKFKFVSTYSEWTYFPQVVWRDDSAGFYTVIPASAILDNPSEPTRYYYVPLAGEAARLAEFVTAPVWQSFPFISPDGIKVAYVRESGGTQSLHVIDASTADRVYTSAPALSILGWHPDSARVAYYAEDPSAPSLLAFGGVLLPLSDTARFFSLNWVSESRYLFLNGEELRLRDLSTPSVLVDSAVSEYDFVLLP
jgi:hypothetical protein